MEAQVAERGRQEPVIAAAVVAVVIADIAAAVAFEAGTAPADGSRFPHVVVHIAALVRNVHQVLLRLSSKLIN